MTDAAELPAPDPADAAELPAPDPADAAELPAPDAARQRAVTLFKLRWRTLLAHETDIGRRVRTLTARTACEEAAKLTESFARAQGVTVPGENPSLAGHGVKYLPEVVEEAGKVVVSDPVLATRLKNLRDALAEGLGTLNPGTASLSRAMQLAALVQSLSALYLPECLKEIGKITREEPHRLFELEDLVASLLADLRARGWTSQGLIDLLERSDDASFDNQLGSIGTAVCSAETTWRCMVRVDLGPYAEGLPVELDGVSVEAESPGGVKGPFLRVDCSAFDPRFAASISLGRVETLLNSASVFLEENLRPLGTKVLVSTDGDEEVELETAFLLEKEPRRAVPGQIERIMRSVWSSSSRRAGDPVADAIRYHHRASAASDPETTLVLLWFGLERLVAGSIDYRGKPGQAVRHLVAKAVTLGKLRRDLTALCESLRDRLNVPALEKLIELAGVEVDGDSVVDRDKCLKFMLSSEPESKKFTGPFYQEDPELVQWYARLRKGLRGENGQEIGKKIAAYLEASRKDVEWQILRIYRARNGVVHTANEPAHVRDLIRHAHFFLTNVIAIAVHYREQNPNRSPAEILAQRCGFYDAFVDLLCREEPHSLTVAALLRPTSLFR